MLEAHLVRNQVPGLGNKYVSVEPKFHTEERVRQHSVDALKTQETLFVPTYLGKRVANVRVEEIPLELNVAWLVATKSLGLEESVSILLEKKDTNAELTGAEIGCDCLGDFHRIWISQTAFW